MRSYYQLIRHNGNRDLFQAVEMSMLALGSEYPLHIHVEGLRGTGKTTIMRAARDILPPIVRIRGCMYNCHPERPHCPEHRNMSPEEIVIAGIETVRRPFYEISHAAKIGTVVGSIDIGKLMDKENPAAALLPGTIPQAHRGIIFIDEINRLADTSPEIVDVLLSVMGTKPGCIQVEETGLPLIELPISVSVWAASNPDEEPGALSQIRKQLSDRFDLSLNMGRANAYRDVLAIIEQKTTENHSIQTASGMLFSDLYTANVSEELKNVLARIYVDFSLESLRAVEAVKTAACLEALIAGRQQVTINDIARVVPLTLGHRADSATVAAILRYLENHDNSSLADDGNDVFVAANDISAQPGMKREKKLGSSFWSNMWAGIRERLSLKRGSGEQNTDGKLPPTGNGGAKKQINAKTANGGDSQSSDGNSNGIDAAKGNKMAGASKQQPQTGNFTQNGKGFSKLPTSTGKPKVVDPSTVDITAPPRAATPLTGLAVGKFVSGED